MSKQKILIVDDDNNIAELISLYLTKECYDTKIVNDGEEALHAFEHYNPNLILLDLMLPGIDGYQVCREIRTKSNVPIIMLSAKGEIFDKVLGLELGADDYMIKPFDSKELVARVKAVLRRAAAAAPAPAPKTLQFGGIVIDDVARTVKADGVPVELTFKEYALLHLFLEHPEEVLARERIMKEVWDTDDLLESRTIDMHVRTLRQKLGAAGEAIRTVRKVGYKLSTEGSDD